MSLYKTLKTDSARETSGVYLEVSGARITVARAGGANSTFEKVASEMVAKHGKALQFNAISNKDAMLHTMRMYAEGCVLNWETNVDGAWLPGIEQEDSDELLPVTVDNVCNTFENLPDLFRMVKETADDAKLYRKNIVDIAVKN